MSLCSFESTHFAEGRFRRAYKGTYNQPPLRGKPCVVKENKENYTWESTDWNMAVKLYEESKKLADQFNYESRCTMSIKFTNVTVGCVSETDNNDKPPKLGEYLLAEDYIPGTFTKWCNNYGYISSDSELMPAFMHWSWVQTKGQAMVADLQGAREYSTYHLTDPALLSNTEGGGKYGCTDTGVEGMAMFFLKHTCNQFCRGLPKPTIGDVVGKHSALTQLEMMMTSTAYAHELKFPQHIRRTMITVFPQVATRATGYY